MGAAGGVGRNGPHLRGASETKFYFALAFQPQIICRVLRQAAVDGARQRLDPLDGAGGAQRFLRIAIGRWGISQQVRHSPVPKYVAGIYSELCKGLTHGGHPVLRILGQITNEIIAKALPQIQEIQVGAAVIWQVLGGIGGPGVELNIGAAEEAGVGRDGVESDDSFRELG